MNRSQTNSSMIGNFAGILSLALEYLKAGNVQEAELIFNDILKIQPDNVTALHFMGIIHYQQKDYEIAMEYIKKALRVGPDYVDALNNLGIVLQASGKLDEAITFYKKALKIDPRFIMANYNLGSAYKEKWQLQKAIQYYQKAIQLNHAFPEAYNNLGNIFQDQGKMDEAEVSYRHAIRLKPECTTYYDNLLLMMNYCQKFDANDIFREHLEFAKQVARPFNSSVLEYKNDLSPDRKLRIGYISPDFRIHSVAYFIEPVIASHNREHCEIFCYSDVDSNKEDEVSIRIKQSADKWKDITGMPDDKVAALVRADRIDILVDLAGHTAHNRLLVFARKPAPVQASWIGYPATTGLSAMNYKIVDSFTDPPGLTDQYYSEQLIRVPGCFLCYRPYMESPEIGTSPFLSNGYISFGSFNYYPKISSETFTVWSTILKRIPNSRLILKSRNFADVTTCQYALGIFAKNGINAERIELKPLTPSLKEHFGMYHQIDIALDTFPYNGTTTTFEALWMGVPVITLEGNYHASRVGMSILTNVGLQKYVANNTNEYVNLAITLSQDYHEITFLRKTLRERMLQSILLDSKRFVAHLEYSYRVMWRNCSEIMLKQKNLS